MVLPNFVDAAVAGEPLPVHGDGRQRRCFCHVADAVEAVLGLLACDDAWGQVVNIGSEEEITIRELAEKVRIRAGCDAPVRLIPYAEAYGEGFEDMERRRPDTGKIRGLIGWSASRTLDEIVDETVAHRRTGVASV
jgi:UDP-glucose 4-epimerase